MELRLVLAVLFAIQLTLLGLNFITQDRYRRMLEVTSTVVIIGFAVLPSISLLARAFLLLVAGMPWLLAPFGARRGPGRDWPFATLPRSPSVAIGVVFLALAAAMTWVALGA